MARYEIVLFATITALEIALCALVYARHLQRRLPFFAAYATTILLCNIGVAIMFARFGFRSLTSYHAYWVALAIGVTARCAAIAELCRDTLKVYQGIWALTSRLLGLTTLAFLVHAAIDAQGQPDWIAVYGLTIERDIEFTSVIILVAMLLIGHYYLLPIEPIQKWIAVGICLFCIVEFVNCTVLRNIFTGYMASWASMKNQVDRVNDVWNTVQAVAADISIAIWCLALRNPLPARAPVPDLLPSEVYGSLSPAVNLRLRAFNDRLEEMLKS